MSFTLVFTGGKGAGKSFSYTKNRVTVGRLKEHDLVLYDTGVSRNHCAISMYAANKYQIEDIGSSNGTIVNGTRIGGPTILNDGDNIVVGPCCFQFKLDNGQAVAGNSQEHYEEGSASAGEGMTQAIRPSDVREAVARAKREQAAKSSAGESPEGGEKERKRVTGQRRNRTTGGNRPAPAESLPNVQEDSSDDQYEIKEKTEFKILIPDLEKSGAERPGEKVKRVTGDHNRRAREAEAKKEAERKAAEEAPQKEITAKVVPRKSLGERFGELSGGKKAAVVLGLIIGVGGIGGLIYKQLGQEVSFSDYSDKTFPINAQNIKKSYGLSNNIDYRCTDKVSLSFDYAGGLVVMSYSVKDIESPNELAIYVNDKLIGYAPTSSSWLNNLQLKIPMTALKPHAKNIIVFDSTNNPPAEDKWAVRQISVKEKPLPEPDPDRAMKSFSIAQESYRGYLVDPANLSTAITHYNDAMLYLEKLDPKPPLYGQIEIALKEAEDALQKIYDDKIYQTYRALRENNTQEAIEILNELLRYLPDNEDKRRQEVLNKLKRYGQR